MDIEIDEAFEKAGIKRNSAPSGLLIWRVKKLLLEKVESKEYGKFYEGDTYVIYNYLNEGHIDAICWSGQNCSEDEKFVAAKKVVELDDILTGFNVKQHQEFQHHESGTFKSLFSKKHNMDLTYLQGGADSALEHVDIQEIEKEKELFKIKGRCHIEISQVPFSESSLNKGDSFLLRKGTKVFLFHGSGASLKEKFKALQYAQECCVKIGNRIDASVKLNILEESILSDKTMRLSNLPPEYQEFCTCLGMTNGQRPTIKEACAGGDDTILSKCTLYRLNDDSGKVVMKEVGETPLSYSLLDTKDTFILESPNKVFLWKGRGATAKERKVGLQMANEFLKAKNLPDYISVSVEIEGHESLFFSSKFYNWPEPVVNLSPVKTSNIAKVEKRKFDFKTLYQKCERVKPPMFDDGSGTVEVWRVNKFKLEKVPESEFGQFYTGDSYVILYSYKQNCKDKHVIYFWIGDHSTADERGTAAYEAVQKDIDLGSTPVQVRIKEGKETEHFLLIFKGQMKVFKGGVQSGFRNAVNGQVSSDTRLFRVRGKNHLNTKAIEVDVSASSLNSNDCFVLSTPDNCYIWFGKNCNGDEQQLARNVASGILKRDSENFLEGKEPQRFWDALGGKKPYAEEPEFHMQMTSHVPRLFEVSNATGNLVWEEIFDFDQDDMDEDDIMVLDTFDTIYIWVGNGARKDEKLGTAQEISDYLKHDPAGRDPNDVNMVFLSQGNEPPQFTYHFESWDPDLFEKKKGQYSSLCESIFEQNKRITAAEMNKVLKVKQFYQKEVLERKEDEGLPEDVDVKHKEQYLHDEVFQAIFHMSKEEFASLKEWKKNKLKRDNNLY